MNVVVELAPYRKRRTVRRLATGLLFGYLAGEWLAPRVEALLALVDGSLDEPAAASSFDR